MLFFCHIGLQKKKRNDIYINCMLLIYYLLYYLVGKVEHFSVCFVNIEN